MKRALICGISGQDGAYLSRFLLGKGYAVFGTSRDAQMTSFSNLKALGLLGKVKLLSAVPVDFRSVFQAVSQAQPDEIYNLSGQSSVGLSFEQPVETLESVTAGTLNFLEVLRFLGRPIRFYNAGSSECFGNTEGRAADECTPFRPRSPYAVAKAAAFWEVANYREAYKLFACSGLLFNHESPLRPERYVTKKIVAGAARIARGQKEKLRLGNLSIQRDWGWAPEYVEAMWLMLQREKPEDFVIATGRTHSLEQFVEEAFSAVNLRWQDHVESDPSFVRLTDIAVGKANPQKAEKELGWRAKTTMKDVVRLMVEAERAAAEK